MDDKFAKVIGQVSAEYLRASMRFGPFASAHEGAAIIREEFDEFWDEVKRNDNTRAREEVVQLAAMAIRFLMDVEN